MAKRDAKSTITLGSGYIYLQAFSSSMPTYSTLCVDTNLLGYIKGGATLEYTEETYTEKDDLGHVQKIITTTENATLKCGLLTWNGDSLAKLIDRAVATTDSTSHTRTLKIGGAPHAKGTYYAIGFKHADSVDGDVYVLLKGKNTAGITLTFAANAGSVVEPTFTAVPHDADGTLIEVIETLDTTSSGG